MKKEHTFIVAESVPDATGFSESQDDLGAGAAAVAPIPESRPTETASEYQQRLENRRRYELVEAIAEHAKGWLRFSTTHEKVPEIKPVNDAIDALIATVKGRSC